MLAWMARCACRGSSCVPDSATGTVPDTYPPFWGCCCRHCWAGQAQVLGYLWLGSWAPGLLGLLHRRLSQSLAHPYSPLRSALFSPSLTLHRVQSLPPFNFSQRKTPRHHVRSIFTFLPFPAAKLRRDVCLRGGAATVPHFCCPFYLPPNPPEAVTVVAVCSVVLCCTALLPATPHCRLHQHNNPTHPSLRDTLHSPTERPLSLPPLHSSRFSSLRQ
ncbi:hypothetical protein GGR56DRAFT_270147 [Xylariaceae sp. FL0804]|nr:hypothetical protein GGR56DRAFT_270147 [Xylariaceae sp. FL0804]